MYTTVLSIHYKPIHTNHDIYNTSPKQTPQIATGSQTPDTTQH